jgi:RNA polymerase sigma factor (sigma-70 family)
MDGSEATTDLQRTLDRTTILEALRGPDNQQVWSLVDQRYRPMMRNFALRWRIPYAAAEDVSQEALAAFAQAVANGTFEREVAGFKRFLFTVTRRQVLSYVTRAGRDPKSLGTGDDAPPAVESIPSQPEMELAWENEWRLAVARQSLLEARAHFSAETYGMFYFSAVEGHPAAEVGKMFGKNPAAVDMAKHHVRTFLRDIRSIVEEAF